MRPGLICLTLLIALVLPACTKAQENAPPEIENVPEAEIVPDPMVGRGEAIAEMACAGCHAIAATDDSQHPDAPPFRLLSQSIDINALEQRFAAGNITDHPDMPNWEFEQIDIAGLVAYLESVQVSAPE